MSAVLLSMVMASAPVAEARVAHGAQCEADHECGVGMYCYESQLCTPCTNCSIYNRDRPPDYPACPKSAQQCGQCLKGYVEEILTDGSRRDMCQLYTTNNEFYIFISAAVVIVMCAVICIGAAVYFRKRKGHNRSDPSCGDPPPYVEGNSPLIESTEQVIRVSDALATQTMDFHCSKERLTTKAIPFLDPQHPYGSY